MFRIFRFVQHEIGDVGTGDQETSLRQAGIGDAIILRQVAHWLAAEAARSSNRDRLHHSPNRLFVSPIPTPLALLGCLDQPCFRQDVHMMGNCRLRETNPLFDLASTKARAMHRFLRGRFRFISPLFQNLQNAAAGGVSNGVKRTIERCIGSHGGLQIPRKSMTVNVGCRHPIPQEMVIPRSFKIEDCGYYFFRIGLYPSPTSFVRIVSASFTSANGPNCTRNSLSDTDWADTNAG